ncbi:MAG: hypothetical protein GF364_20145 [Candidatus Lokiarchaeota archaeon]|nr:hypothetical protein [Candidatus Lokiarchaeota archaeon]
MLSTPDGNDYTRGDDIVTVSGFFDDAYGNHIKNAQVQLIVETKTNTDVTSLISSWISSGEDFQYTSSSNGQFVFQFRFPTSMHGLYDIRVEFVGHYKDTAPSCPAEQYYLITIDSTPEYEATIWAGTSLTAYYYPSSVMMGQPITVWGTLTFDNGTVVNSGTLNVTFVDEYGELCDAGGFTQPTVSAGDYSQGITITWAGSDTIYVEFFDVPGSYIEGVKKQATYNEP